MRSTDLQNLIDVGEKSIFRWFSAPYPRHALLKSVRNYALPEVVARLRLRRKRGLYSADLASVVTFDTNARSKREVCENVEFMWLGDDAEERAGEFWAVLDGEEVERARSVQKEVRAAAIQAGLPGVGRLRQKALVHPSAARFILSGEAVEIPCTDGGWRNWTAALWAINPEQNQLLEAA